MVLFRALGGIHLVRGFLVLPSEIDVNGADPTCTLLPPSSDTPLKSSEIRTIAAALATRLNSQIGTVKEALQDATITEYGKVRRIDSEAGDTMRSCNLCVTPEDGRDATYVRVCFFLTAFFLDTLTQNA